MALFKIGSTDVPAEGVGQDLFHIETYIDGLSTFIKECTTPITKQFIRCYIERITDTYKCR